MVDPATVTATAGTWAEAGFSGDQSGSTHLKVGTPDSGSSVARSFLQFANLSNIAGQRVTDVSFTIFDSYAWHCSSAEPFNVLGVVNSWTPSGITSPSNEPGLGGVVVTINAQAPSNICANTSWSTSTYQAMTGTFNASGVDTVQSWLVNPATNFGLAIAAASETDNLQWKVFNSTNTSTPPYLSVTTVPNAVPAITSMYPTTNYSSPTLTPELTASAIDSDNFPNPLTYTFQVYDASSTSTTPIASSTALSTPDWTVPAGALAWGKTYFWLVNVFDGFNYAPLTANFLSTPVPQPLVTSSLSANDGHGFSPSVANYTTQMTDAQLAGIGPRLAIERNYNSRDPRVAEAFGAGWSSVLDSRVQLVGSLATVTYPTGSEITWGQNADGSFSSPSGRYATLKRTTTPDGFTLTDKNATVYTFARTLSAGV